MNKSRGLFPRFHGAVCLSVSLVPDRNELALERREKSALFNVDGGFVLGEERLSNQPLKRLPPFVFKDRREGHRRGRSLLYHTTCYRSSEATVPVTDYNSLFNAHN